MNLICEEINRRYLPIEPRAWVRACYIYPASTLPLCEERLIVEVGPGRGDFLFHLAEVNPEAAVVGIEIKCKRVDKLIKRAERRKLANVRIVQDDARNALPRLIADGSVDEIHINFPDPWPKKRHEKNRAINEAFLSVCLNKLKPGGTIHFITDHKPYAHAVASVFSGIEGFESCYEGQIVFNMPNAYPTFFAKKWIQEGREIAYQKYRRKR